MALAARLREYTADAHTQTERKPFIVELMSGRAHVSAYADYLQQLLPVYAAMEVAASDPWGLHVPALDRTEALRCDLAALGCEVAQPRAAAEAYATHLTHLVTSGDALRLVAHHYTRYLGDLSGGQAIAALVARHYAIGPEALAFYRFEGIDDIVRFKQAYRSRLDAMDLNAEQEQVLLDEAVLAFEFNGRMFDELGTRWGSALPAAVAS